MVHWVLPFSVQLQKSQICNLAILQKQKLKLLIKVSQLQLLKQLTRLTTKVSMILSFFDDLYFVTINQFKYVPMFVNDYSKFI